MRKEAEKTQKSENAQPVPCKIQAPAGPSRAPIDCLGLAGYSGLVPLSQARRETDKSWAGAEGGRRSGTGTAAAAAVSLRQTCFSRRFQGSALLVLPARNVKHGHESAESAESAQRAERAKVPPLVRT